MGDEGELDLETCGFQRVVRRVRFRDKRENIDIVIQYQID
jgi:hypothetical protein